MCPTRDPGRKQALDRLVLIDRASRVYDRAESVL